MSLITTVKTNPPQAFISSYAPRIRTYGNSLLSPIIPATNTLPPARTTKRGTTAINYAEDGFDDEDFDDSEGPRRPTGLRSLRRDESNVDKTGQTAQLGKELTAPVEVQGIWREWMGKPKRAMWVHFQNTALLQELSRTNGDKLTKCLQAGLKNNFKSNPRYLSHSYLSV